MNRSIIESQISSLVSAYVPRNVRSFKYRIFDGLPQPNMLGFCMDPTPFDGKVIARTDDAIILKTGRAEFAVLDRALVTASPDEGVNVHVTPYARRRFDGLRADTPEERTEYSSDGKPYTIKTHILGSAPAKLPIPEPKCPELQDLIRQLEELPAPDRFRKITHMLVDAGAKDFNWVDPTPDKIIETPPAISFAVSTVKFEGRVTVLYDRAGDVYVIELRQGDDLVERIDEVYFDSLGEMLERQIDDGQWRRIQVDVLDTKAARSRQGATA